MKKISFSIYSILFLLFLMGETITNAQEIAVEALHHRKKGDTIVPQYPGGIEKFIKYMSQNIRYPLGPQLRGKSAGRVFVSFIVDTNGVIIKPKIKKSVDHEYDRDILRVLAESQRWTPGSINGKKLKVPFSIPIRFHDFPNSISKSARAIKNTNVLLHGSLLGGRDEQDAIRYLYSPFYEVDAQFSKALFGLKYNSPLFIVNDLNTEPKKYNKKGLAQTLQLLEQSDSTKFKFQLDEINLPYHQWRKYLDVDSVSMINIYSLSQAQERKGDAAWGIVSLWTEKGINRIRKAMIKASADKATFFNLVERYRKGMTSLPAELIYIDENQYNTKIIFDSLDLSAIHGLRITKAEDIKGQFQDFRSRGFIQLYTKSFRADHLKWHAEKLNEILLSYRQSKEDTDEYVIFLNFNERINLPQLYALNTTHTIRVHIISKEEAKLFFGCREEKPIMYVFVDYAQRKNE